MGVNRRSDARRRVPPAVRRRDERGAAAVEFALVLPILLLLLFGIIAYGYMLSFRGSLSQAAAEGARAAAVYQTRAGTTALDEAQKAVNDAIRTYGVQCTGTPSGASSTLQMTRSGHSGSAGTCVLTLASCGTGGTSSASCVTVALSYRYDGNELIPLPIVDSFMPDTLSYTASARVS